VFSNKRIHLLLVVCELCKNSVFCCIEVFPTDVILLCLLRWSWLPSVLGWWLGLDYLFECWTLYGAGFLVLRLFELNCGLVFGWRSFCGKMHVLLLWSILLILWGGFVQIFINQFESVDDFTLSHWGQINAQSILHFSWFLSNRLVKNSFLRCFHLVFDVKNRQLVDFWIFSNFVVFEHISRLDLIKHYRSQLFGHFCISVAAPNGKVLKICKTQTAAETHEVFTL